MLYWRDVCKIEIKRFVSITTITIANSILLKYLRLYACVSGYMFRSAFRHVAENWHKGRE